MPPLTASRAIESLNTYFAALGVSTRRVNEAIASVAADLLADRLALEIRTRLDSLDVPTLLQVLAAVSPDAAAESLPPVPANEMPHCTYCGARPLPGVACCGPTLPPAVTAPLCDLLPGGNKARSKPHRSK